MADALPTYQTMQATLEVTYFKTTVRLWLDSKQMPFGVEDVQSVADRFGQRIKDRLMKRWEGSFALSASRDALDAVFADLAAIPGILAAQIVELHPNDVDVRRGYYVEYAPPTA